MEKNELMKYLKAAIVLETDVVTQEGIIKNFVQNCEARRPGMQTMKEPSEPREPARVTYHYAEHVGASTAFVFGLGIIVIGLIILFATGVFGAFLISLIIALPFVVPFFYIIITGYCCLFHGFSKTY